MNPKHLTLAAIASIVVVAAASLVVSADRPRLRASKTSAPSRLAIPTDLPPIAKLPQQVSLNKAQSVLQFDDGSCESGVGATFATVTAFHEFDVPTQCAAGGLQIVAVTARMNTYTAFTGVLGQAGATPPSALAGPFVGISSPIGGFGPCTDGNTAVTQRAVTGATVTGTANFFFGLQNIGFIGRDTNGASAGRAWLNCAGCSDTQYSPAELAGGGLGGNLMLRVTVEDENCLPAELEGACCLPDGCRITTQDDCAAAGGTFLGEGTECFSDSGDVADYVDTPALTILDSMTVEDTIVVNDSFVIHDLDVDFVARHTWVGDLEIRIEGPDGTIVLLQDNVCGNNDNEDVIFDDEAGPLVCGTPVTGGAPLESLSAFDGTDALGTWTIRISDTVGGDVGVLDQWSLHFDEAVSNCDGEGACCTNGPGTASDCIETSQSACEEGGGLFVGGPCERIESCTALYVDIDTMSATKTARGVLVAWTTAAEIDNLGFRVLRESGSREKRMTVVSGFIPATGSGIEGASYQFLDNQLDQIGAATRYWLESVDVYGRTERHGPIDVTGSRERPQGRTR